jgi:hypothetical protein
MPEAFVTHSREVGPADRSGGLLCVGADDATARSIALLVQATPATYGDPYAAMCAIASSPAKWQMVVLDLQQLYDGELAIIPAIRTTANHCRVVVAHADGRPAMLARAIRLGIDGLLTGGKIEWLTTMQAAMSPPVAERAITPPQDSPPPTPEAASPATSHALQHDHIDQTDHADQADQAELRSVADIYQDEPLLTADELKALLSDHDIRPTAS